MIARLALRARGTIGRVADRFVAAADYLLSDRHSERGLVEIRLALAQAAFVGAPFVMLAILFWTVLP